MRQFDVCQNPSEQSRPFAPYVVVLQSHFLRAMPTVVIAPMLISEGRQPYSEVSASVTFSGADYILSVAELVAADAKRLTAPVGTLRDYEDAIRRCIERLFTGF